MNFHYTKSENVTDAGDINVETVPEALSYTRSEMKANPVVGLSAWHVSTMHPFRTSDTSDLRLSVPLCRLGLYSLSRTCHNNRTCVLAHGIYTMRSWCAGSQYLAIRNHLDKNLVLSFYGS